MGDMKNKVKVILVDDEVKALHLLESKLLEMFPELNIIGSYDDPEKAIREINVLKPQILFLDINMPKYSGFDLLKHIYNPKFEVVFVTAYDNYAITAIKHAAIGYVLKPLNNEELKEATVKAIEQLYLKNNLIKPKMEKISIPFNSGFALKPLSEIIRLEGFEGYTKIILTNETIISSYNIGLFNKILADNNFMMVHKSHLVNIQYVDKYLNEGTVILSNSDKIPVSRSNKAELIRFFKNNH